MRRQVWFESTLELDLLQILKKCGPYIGVLEQPAKLDRKVLGFGKGPYTPDYLVWLIGPDGLPRDPVLVEVKYEDDLRKDWRIIHPKVLAGIRFAKRQGWRFALVTERHLREAMPLIPHRRWEPQPSFRLRNPIHVLILRKAYHQVLAHDWPQESERLLIPALYIQAPPHADRGDLFRDIAEKLHVPAWDRIPYSILRTQTRKYIRDAGVKVIFVDELHNLIAGGENSKRTILDDLRYFSNEFATPLITAGTERAFAAISSDKQYKSRLKATLLPEWSSSDFVGLMRALEQVFTLPTGDLTRREICQSVWEYCHRKIGPCIHLVNLAVRASRIQGGAPITPELLTAVIAEEAVYEGPKSV